MNIIKFKIDEKSLYYGIKNDFHEGQTATVHTPINQSKNPNKWHHDIIQLTTLDIDKKNIPEMLIRQCTKKTTSKAQSKITDFFEFENLLIDGITLNCNSNFGIYIKEEIDKNTINRKGECILNTHYGRKKLHYPISLKYNTDGYNIDNSNVLNSILVQNGGFAFVVRAFEYSIEEKTLNFITTIVGPENILLSNVFKRQKGTGKKLLLNNINIEDYEILNEVCYYSKKENNIDIQNIFEQANRTKVENGKIGENYVLEMLKNKYKEQNVYHTSIDYPTSPYDIEFYLNGRKKYVEVKATQSNKKIFNMSMGEIKFMNQYSEDYTLYLITNVKNKIPEMHVFTREQIIKLKFEHPSTRFYA